MKEHELFQRLKLFVKTSYGKIIFNYLDTNLWKYTKRLKVETLFNFSVYNAYKHALKNIPMKQMTSHINQGRTDFIFHKGINLEI